MLLQLLPTLLVPSPCVPSRRPVGGGRGAGCDALAAKPCWGPWPSTSSCAHCPTFTAPAQGRVLVALWMPSWPGPVAADAAPGFQQPCGPHLCPSEPAATEKGDAAMSPAVRSAVVCRALQRIGPIPHALSLGSSVLVKVVFRLGPRPALQGELKCRRVPTASLWSRVRCAAGTRQGCARWWNGDAVKGVASGASRAYAGIP